MANSGVVFSFQIADDLDSSRTSDGLVDFLVGLGFHRLVDGGLLDAKLNGTNNSWESRRSPSPGWTGPGIEPSWNRYPSKTKAIPIDCDAVEMPSTMICCLRAETNWHWGSWSEVSPPPCCWPFKKFEC